MHAAARASCPIRAPCYFLRMPRDDRPPSTSGKAAPSSAPVWALSSLCFCFAAALGFANARYVPDARNYRLLALGLRAQVAAPFSARALAPSAAAGLARLAGMGVDRGFFILGILCFAAFVLCAAYLLAVRRAGAGLAAAVFLLPVWIDFYHNYYLPDLLYSALIALLLVLLVSGRLTLAASLLLPAFLARESSLLTSACLGVAAWRRIPRRAVIAGAAATVAGAWASRHFMNAGAANAESLGAAPYIAGKLVWSFFRNILGLPLWTNVATDCSPIWSIALPGGRRLGALRAVGFCGPSLWGPARTALAWLGLFGVAPGIALRCAISARSPRSPLRELWSGRGPEPAAGHSEPGMAIAFRFAAVYGLINLLLAPLLGASVDRLVEYAWPLYFVALAWLLRAGRPLPRPALLLAIHLVTAWMAWLAFRSLAPGGQSIAALAAAALNAAAFLLARDSSPPAAIPAL